MTPTRPVNGKERSMKLQLTIPDDVGFADLRLSRGPAGVEFDWAPIERICEASGVDIALFRERHEDNVGTLIAHWYAAHRAAGGEPDPVAEDLKLEAMAEDALGIIAVEPPDKVQ